MTPISFFRLIVFLMLSSCLGPSKKPDGLIGLNTVWKKEGQIFYLENQNMKMAGTYRILDAWNLKRLRWDIYGAFSIPIAQIFILDHEVTVINHLEKRFQKRKLSEPIHELGPVLRIDELWLLLRKTFPQGWNCRPNPDQCHKGLLTAKWSLGPEWELTDGTRTLRLYETKKETLPEQELDFSWFEARVPPKYLPIQK